MSNLLEILNTEDDSLTVNPPAGSGVDLKSIINSAKEKGVDNQLKESVVFKSSVNADRQYLNYEQHRVCRNCNMDKEDGCCMQECELFDDMYEAVEEGFDMNPCIYCPKYKNKECSGVENIDSYTVKEKISVEAIKDKKSKIYKLFKEIGIKELTQREYMIAKNSKYEVDFNLLNIARDKILRDEIELGENKLSNKFKVNVKEYEDRYVIKVGERYAVYLKDEEELVLEGNFDKEILMNILMNIGVTVESARRV